MNSNHENNEDSECKNILNKKNYYEILGLNNDASEEEIRKSYKKLAVKFHPDKNKSKFASDAFKKIAHSFTVLSNKEKKDNYDKYGTEDEIVNASHANNNAYTQDMDPFVIYS